MIGLGLCVLILASGIHYHVAGVTALQRQEGDVDISKATLTSISMVSANEGWAVGTLTNVDGKNQAQGVILHYQNGAWKQYHGFFTFPPLHAVAMTSAKDGWAVGDQGIILRYNGSDWFGQGSRVSTSLTSLSMLSPAEGWAGGTAGFLHYQGGSWIQVPQTTPLPAVSSIAMVSPAEGWAIGEGSVLLHFTAQGGWQVAINDPGINALALTMNSASDGWAVGGNGPKGNALHYSNGKWQPARIGDNTTVLYTIAMLSASEGWAAGRSGADGAFFHYLNGKWTRVESPAPVVPHALAMVSSAEGWAMGEKGLMLEYADGEWC